ncbi:MAG: nucleoside hydrolase [Oligoflexales bacterium]|nr:nucleoside hydrolase [Oligoflexales bacterium]
MKHKIILDCDPGHDDAVAILMALGAREEIDLLGITCVAGNSTVDNTIVNALKICELAGRPDIKVFKGMSRPLVRELVTAPEIHGVSGLAIDDPSLLPDPAMSPQKAHAVDFIIDTLMASKDGEVILCPTGPQTNIAMALLKEPQIIPKISQIVFMGGAGINPGNVTPSAEFNIYVDPHAAHVVLSSGIKTVMMGLDVTHKVQTTKKRLEAILGIGTRLAKTVHELLNFFNKYDKRRYRFEGAPLHDPCVIAYVLKPELFKLKHINVEIEISSEKTMGQTVADYWGATRKPPNCLLAEDVDDNGFYDLLLEKLRSFD